MSEHGDLHGPALNVWGEECAPGDPQKPPNGESQAAISRAYMGPRGRKRKDMELVHKHYRVIEQYEAPVAGMMRPMLQIQCDCGLSKPRVIQRCSWLRSPPAACRACRSLRAAATP